MSEIQPSKRIRYHKLVRDAIPEIIRNGGQKCEAVIMTEEQYQHSLREKLIEEAHEAAEASKDNLTTEIADMYEVLDTLMRCYDIKEAEVRNIQARRRAERGGFEKRLQLLWVQ